MTELEFHKNLTTHQASLYRFAYNLTSNKVDADDLVQDTFLKALKYCNKFVYETNFKAWLFTILKNTFINNYRRSINHNSFIDSTKEGTYIHASGSDIPDTIYFSKELEKIIEDLDDNFKFPFKMHHQGFKYKEIAETLDLNIGTVKSRIHFSRKKLIQHLNS